MSYSRRRRPESARMRPRSTATSRRRASFSTARRPRPPARPERSPAPPAPPRCPAVEIVFVAVRGRARLHVEELRGKPERASRLEARMAVAIGGRLGEGGAGAGTVLVLSAAPTLDLPSLIAAVARHAGEVRN